MNNAATANFADASENMMENPMTTAKAASYCNAVAVLHIDGDRLHPAIDLNSEQTLVAPESYPNSHEASAAVEKVVAELKADVVAKLTAMGWRHS